MNDVNLNNPDLKLVRSNAQAPGGKALSSSQAEGGKAPPDLAASGSSGSAIQSPQAATETSRARSFRLVRKRSGMN